MLNKHYRPMEDDYFWHKMDRTSTTHALQVSEITEETANWIYEDDDKKKSIIIK